MRVIKPQTLGLLTRPFEFRREFWLGCAAIAFLPIGGSPSLLLETALWPFLAEELPPDQPLDAVIPKARAEFVMVAHAFAPGGVVAPMVSTGARLGLVTKQLDVIGDREFDRTSGQITEPVAFSQMKLDWTRAYGGRDFADNPLGKGVTADGSDGRIFPVENIMRRNPDGERTRGPAAYGPVDQMWPVRTKLSGTYDDAWLKQDFPGFARDIDWHFFNIAPADQWLPQPLTGNETYAFKNLHPDHPLLEGRLPGIAARLFVSRKAQGGDGGFEEVPLTPTTVWFFPHRERLVLVYHGRTRLAEEDGSDIARVVLGADRIGAPRPVEDFHSVMVKRTDPKHGALYALRDQDLVPAELLLPAVADAGPSPLQQILARQIRRADREAAASREKMRALGLDPDRFLGPSPPPPDLTMPALEELPAIIAAAEAQARTEKEKAEAAAIAKKAETAAQLAASGMPEEEIRQLLDAKPKGPPAFSAAAMQSQIDAIRAMGLMTPEAEVQLASPETITQWQTAEREIRNSYRLTAQHQERADALPAKRNEEIRRLVSGDTAAARALYDLHGADLSGLDLAGIDLSGVCLDGADLTETSFAGAKLVNAVLAHSRMVGCVLDGADLTGANLGKAQLLGATFNRATLKNTVLAGADLTNVSMAGADLEGADLTDTITAGADFSNVHAPGILAMRLSLRGFHAPGIVLAKAKFIECDLEHANLVGAALEQAVFLQCNLASVRLVGARMRKAVFVQQCSLENADLSRADLREANLRETALQAANLDGANIEQADLSSADLTGAVLTHARAAGSRLIAANLRRADLSYADFSTADLSRADLRGTNLIEVSVYEANLQRTKLDRDTRRRGMFTTRMRYLPIYEPPKEAGS
ncbi:MAG TPA: DUF2169 domain-containing protein [Acetobacteraceae bacterium]